MNPHPPGQEARPHYLFLRETRLALQGYLAHKKTHPPKDPTVGLCLGSKGDPRGVGVFLRARYPCRKKGEKEGRKAGCEDRTGVPRSQETVLIRNKRFWSEIFLNCVRNKQPFLGKFLSFLRKNLNFSSLFLLLDGNHITQQERRKKT